MSVWPRRNISATLNVKQGSWMEWNIHSIWIINCVFMSSIKRSCPTCLSHLCSNECLNILILYIVRLFFKDVRLNLYTLTLCHFQIYICISFINKVHKKHVSLLCSDLQMLLFWRERKSWSNCSCFTFLWDFAAVLNDFTLAVKEALKHGCNITIRRFCKCHLVKPTAT